MACPSGCPNGGGQIRVDGDASAIAASRQQLARINEILDTLEQVQVGAASGVSMWAASAPRRDLATRYHAVPEMGTAAMQW